MTVERAIRLLAGGHEYSYPSPLLTMFRLTGTS